MCVYVTLCVCVYVRDTAHTHVLIKHLCLWLTILFFVTIPLFLYLCLAFSIHIYLSLALLSLAFSRIHTNEVSLSLFLSRVLLWHTRYRKPGDDLLEDKTHYNGVPKLA